jgi:hypothetical protein
VHYKCLFGLTFSGHGVTKRDLAVLECALELNVRIRTHHSVLDLTAVVVSEQTNKISF